MVFNATFNNISVISWQSVLLMEGTGGSEENNQHVASHWQLYHIKLYTSPCSRFELTTSVVIGTDYIGSCKCNYHTITATTVPLRHWCSILYVDYVMSILLMIQAVNVGWWLKTIVFNIVFNSVIAYKQETNEKRVWISLENKRPKRYFSETMSYLQSQS